MTAHRTRTETTYTALTRQRSRLCRRHRPTSALSVRHRLVPTIFPTLTTITRAAQDDDPADVVYEAYSAAGVILYSATQKMIQNYSN